MALSLAVLVLTLIFGYSIVKLFFFTKKQMQLWSTFRDVPTPPQAPIPLLGHAMLLRGDTVQTYKNILNMVNPLVEQGHEIGHIWLGNVPVLFVAGANSAEVLLHSSRHIQKAYFYEFLHPWLGTGLLTSGGEKWKVRRRLLTPTFHFKILQDFIEVMNEQSVVFAKSIESYADTGKTFNIFNTVTLCALDIICETAMGKSVHAQENKDSDYVTAIYRISELLQDRQRSPWLWPDFSFYLSKIGKEFTKHLNVLHSTSQSIIRERMKNMKSSESSGVRKRLAFLDMLLETSDGGKVLSFSDIQEEVDTFMFEGHDTTSAAMTWALHLIGSHPDVQLRIQEELDQVLGDEDDKPITMEEVRKLEYLELVIKESLRLFPSVPFFGRITSDDCELNGHHIPAGTNCILITQLINSNKKHWTDPEKFIPERFTSDNSVGRHPYSYLPFSAGPRNCIGQRFALMEEKVVLAHILKKYNVVSQDTTKDLGLMADIILRPANGIRVKIEKRKK